MARRGGSWIDPWDRLILTLLASALLGLDHALSDHLGKMERRERNCHCIGRAAISRLVLAAPSPAVLGRG